MKILMVAMTLGLIALIGCTQEEPIEITAYDNGIGIKASNGYPIDGQSSISTFISWNDIDIVGIENIPVATPNPNDVTNTPTPKIDVLEIQSKNLLNRIHVEEMIKRGGKISATTVVVDTDYLEAYNSVSNVTIFCQYATDLDRAKLVHIGIDDSIRLRGRIANGDEISSFAVRVSHHYSEVDEILEAYGTLQNYFYNRNFLRNDLLTHILFDCYPEIIDSD